MLYGKIPPQALEFEEAVLGACMLESNRLSEVIGILPVEAFYKDAHQKIWQSIVTLYDSGHPVDLLTVTESLRTAGNLEYAGGPVALVNLTNGINSSANVEVHARVILEMFIKRELIRVASEVTNEAYDDTTDCFDVLGKLEHGATKINDIAAGGGTMRAVHQIMVDVEKAARRREEMYKSGRCTGIPTGIRLMDRFTAGWQNGDLVILAGRPSMGKTALMLHHAISSGVPCCIYSLEMSEISLVNRLVLSMCDLEASKFRAGAMGAEDWEKFYKAKSALSEMPIYIDENPQSSTRYIKSHSKMMKDRGACEIVFVDYLQLVDMRSDERGRNREQEVSTAAREFKIIAKSLDVPVILLSQLSRACESREDKKPRLSDLRESGAIEQDADVVIFAYRPAYYGILDEEGNSQEGIGYEIIAKGRNIGIGEVPFEHNPEMTKIYDYSPDNYDHYKPQPLAPPANIPF